MVRLLAGARTTIAAVLPPSPAAVAVLALEMGAAGGCVGTAFGVTAHGAAEEVEKMAQTIVVHINRLLEPRLADGPTGEAGPKVVTFTSLVLPVVEHAALLGLHQRS